jgi:hypothetical protein
MNEVGLSAAAMRPFVQSKDFETSTQFYTDLGISPRPLGADLAKAALGIALVPVATVP